ncbi:MAG TPA: hypothetical protein VK446_05830 [Methylocystis sp.]|nr:hypothetical protein [Methylocystis sp.]
MTLEQFFADSPLILATLAQSPRDEGEAAPVTARKPQPPQGPRRLYLAAGPARQVFDDLHAACAERELALA